MHPGGKCQLQRHHIGVLTNWGMLWPVISVNSAASHFFSAFLYGLANWYHKKNTHLINVQLPKFFIFWYITICKTEVIKQKILTAASVCIKDKHTSQDRFKVICIVKHRAYNLRLFKMAQMSMFAILIHSNCWTYCAILKNTISLFRSQYTSHMKNIYLHHEWRI